MSDGGFDLNLEGRNKLKTQQFSVKVHNLTNCYHFSPFLGSFRRCLFSSASLKSEPEDPLPLGAVGNCVQVAAPFQSGILERFRELDIDSPPSRDMHGICLFRRIFNISCSRNLTMLSTGLAPNSCTAKPLAC